MAEIENDQMYVHIDAAEKRKDLPDLDQSIRCKDHPDLESETGFGLAGGGFGIYTYCGECGAILSKSCEGFGEG